MIRIYIFCIAFLGICFHAFPQAGSLDPDFLPNMKGSKLISDFGDYAYLTFLQSDGKIILANRSGKLSRIDISGNQDMGFQSAVHSIIPIKGIRQFISGQILLFGEDFYSTVGAPPLRYGIALLNSNGSLNTAFQNILMDGSQITDVEILNDGKILLAGKILLDDGNSTSPFSLLRLLPDGSVDPGFSRVSFDKIVNTIHIFPNGKILAGGEFSTVDQNPTKPLVLLNSDGSVDPSFSTNYNNAGVYRIIPCPNGRFLLTTHDYKIVQIEPTGLLNPDFQSISPILNRINTPIVSLSDGSILVGYSLWNYESGSSVKKYSANGIPLSGFEMTLTTESTLASILILPGNQIFISGDFNVEDKINSRFALFSSDGELLNSYPNLWKAVSRVNSIAVQPDQKIVIGGSFLSVWGKHQHYLARLLPDGELDSTFRTNIPFENYSITTVRIQSDGKILALRNTAPVVLNSEITINQCLLYRYLENGTFDSTFLNHFPPNWNNFNQIELQPNGKILVAGPFDTLFNKSRKGLIRLFPDGSIDESFQCEYPARWDYSKSLTLSIQPDGKILYGGYSFDGTTGSNTIIRLLKNGQTDPEFQKVKINGSGFCRVKMNVDSSFLVMGFFDSITGFPGVHQGLVRMSKNGEEVLSHFDFLLQESGQNYVSDCFVQSDGKIILSGRFRFASGALYSMLRIYPDGTLDPSFPPNPEFTFYGHSLAFQPSRNRILLTSESKTLPGNEITGIRGFSIGEFLPNNPCLISGSVTRSAGSNCESLPGSTPVPSQIIMANPGPYYGMTNDDGQYSIQTDTGSYQISQILSVNSSFSSVRTQICPPDSLPISVHIANPGDSSGGHHFSDDVPECARLFLTIGADRRRRCARNQTVIMVHNIGNLASKPTKIFVKFPRYVSLLSASQTFTFHPTDSTYSFELNPIAPNDWKTIQITDSVLCIPGITGIVQCTKAWLSNNNFCNPSPNWDGADLKVSGRCSGLNPRFTIKNTGAPMSAPANYRLFADSILAASENFLLGSNDSVQVIPEFNNPNITRLEVPQSAFHPYETFTFAELNCSNIPRLAVWFPASTESPDEQTTCREIRDSYDPNDKQVSPKGQTEEGFVTAGKTFDYTIRFQNTGNDTAYKVVVRDYVDEDFDLSSFVAGASSHPYTVSVSGKGKAILDFTFNRINLVDSATNPTQSQGFVSFRIKPKTETPIGSRLFNVADIYFDQNDPIRTNHTLNTVYEPSIVDDNLDTITTVLNTSDWNISVYPNPALDNLSIFSNKQSELELFTVMGQRKDHFTLNTGRSILNIAHLPKGIYFLQFSSGSGKKTKRLIRQ